MTTFRKLPMIAPNNADGYVNENGGIRLRSVECCQEEMHRSAL